MAKGLIELARLVEAPARTSRAEAQLRRQRRPPAQLAKFRFPGASEMELAVETAVRTAA
jgi:hypothetical protein